MNMVIKIEAHQERPTLASPCLHTELIHLKYNFSKKNVLMGAKLMTLLSVLCMLLRPLTINSQISPFNFVFLYTVRIYINLEHHQPGSLIHTCVLPLVLTSQ